MPLTVGTHFSMTITNPIQIILGTNGSGKSRLVNELSPFPPNVNDYTKQGSKVIKIEHNGRAYTLKTVFAPSTKHSFIIDNEENLNEGGTATVQARLIKEHFGFTQEINTLLHDQELFTSMSPSRKKEWFIALCETDYSYAIKQYNKLKEKHRDCLGALKLAKKRLAAETEKTLKSEEQAKIHEEVTQLHALLSHLLEYRKPVEYDTDNIEVELDRLQNQIYKSAQQLQTQLSKDTLFGGYSLDQLRVLSDRISQSLNTLNAFLDDYTKQYNDNLDKIKILQQAEQNTIDTLQEEILLLTSQKQSILDKVNITVLHSPTVAYESFQNIKSILTEICTTIPSNRDRRFSNDVLKQTKEYLSSLQIKKQAAIEYISNKQAQLKHLLSHKESQLISCTKCNHRFSLVYNEDTCKELDSLIQSAQYKLDSLNKEICEGQAYIDACLEYSALYRQYAQITLSHPTLQPYWDDLKENNIITRDPKSAVHYFNQYEQSLKLQVDADNIEDKIKKKQNLLDSLRNVGTDSLQSLIETNKRLYANVGTTTDKISSKSLKLNTINNLIQRKKTVKSICDSVDKLLGEHSEQIEEYNETTRREMLNALIRQLQSELGAKEHILHLAANQKSIIDNIEEQISDLEVDRQALSTLIDQLSPNDGLIAQGLLGFINSFIGQMNAFIEKVWSYPMIIGSCDVQDNESLDLDYKFPVSQGDDEGGSPDVAQCSNGMKEIINLSFKITAMKYLNLLNTPLYLDEFGAAMDIGHRAEVISLIKTFNEQKTFSQMFIVSHDVTQYNSLPNSEVCVLCDIGIAVPQKRNEHVVFK
jgi:ABC-type hemin transport system ATPase subunit